MRPARHAWGTVLVFGENLNDSQSIRELLLAANESLDERRVADSPVIAGHVRRLGLQPLHLCRSYARMTTVARSIR